MRLLIALVVALTPLTGFAEEGAWRSLFNGKDLAGWDTYLGPPHPSVEGLDQLKLKRDAKGKYLEHVGLNRDPKQVYSVVTIDGAPAIRISGEIYGAITSHDEFENYQLRFEQRWGDKRWPPRPDRVRDSGVLYHCVGEQGASPSGAWMQSCESQIQEGDFGDFWSVCKVMVDVEAERPDPKGPLVFQPGGQKFTGVTERVVRNPKSEQPFGEWNTVEIYAVGQTAVHVNNGKPNMVLTNIRRMVEGREEPLTRGKIQLQSEAAEVYYRNIEVRPISEIPDEILRPQSDE
jgi:hypothetical protein